LYAWHALNITSKHQSSITSKVMPMVNFLSQGQIPPAPVATADRPLCLIVQQLSGVKMG